MIYIWGISCRCGDENNARCIFSLYASIDAFRLLLPARHRSHSGVAGGSASLG